MMESLTASKQLPPKYKQRYFLETLRDSVGFLKRAPENYPEILRFQLLSHKVNVVNHPDLARYVLQENHKNYLKGEAYSVLALLLGNGLINSEGDFWKRQRRLAQPAFHRDSLRRISEIVNDSTLSMIQRWKPLEGQTVNFTREMAALTIEIVARALFTADVSTNEISAVWQSVNHLNDMAIRMIRNPLALPFWMPLPSYMKSRKSIARLDEIVYGIIRKRQQGGTFAPDLLQLLLEARDEETGEGMNELQLRDEVMTIFLAGHETTVNALSWTWYLLKQHAEAEGKLKAESDALSDKISFDDLPSLRYGKNVMNESMRIFPPVYAIGRKLVNEDSLNGYHVPLGTRVLINIIGIHHHPGYWDKPQQFMPERFDTFDNKNERYRFAFIPFGGGPRVCIGNNFAMMEMQIINALLSRHVEMELESHDIQPIPQITLKPGSGVMMKMKKVKV